MIGWLVRTAWSLFVLAIVLYFVFCVPLGKYTLSQHLMRIASTDEAQDLEDEITVKGRELQRQIKKQVQERDKLDKRAAEPAETPVSQQKPVPDKKPALQPKKK